jgi:excisionase family DNA binding protein
MTKCLKATRDAHIRTLLEGANPVAVLDATPTLNYSEVALIFRVDRSTIYRWVREGHLPSIKVGRRSFIRSVDLRTLLLGDAA